MEIVRLQDGHGSASAYCLPTSTGTIYVYFDLAKAIGPGHSIYGIQLADRTHTGKFKEFSSLQEMVICDATWVSRPSSRWPHLLDWIFVCRILGDRAGATADQPRQVRSIGGDNRSRTAFYILHAAFANETFCKIRFSLGDKNGDAGRNRRKSSLPLL